MEEAAVLGSQPADRGCESPSAVACRDYMLKGSCVYNGSNAALCLQDADVCCAAASVPAANASLHNQLLCAG